MSGELTTFAVLKPGDRALMLVDGMMSSYAVDERRRILADRFPDVEFTFVTGVSGVLVQRSHDDIEAPVGSSGSSTGATE